MELEVGQFVRTDNGIIGKIYEKIGDMFTYKDSNRDYITYDLLHSEIIKASYNIIDILEVGDYVNGKQVIETYYKSDEKWHLEIVDSRLLTHDELKHVNIQSIVTKEQFEQMAYKVGE